jgi:hypothetical protein
VHTRFHEVLALKRQKRDRTGMRGERQKRENDEAGSVDLLIVKMMDGSVP